MIDVHCHLNFHSFEKDIDSVIQKALQKGVSHIINVGTKIDSSQKAVELAQQYDNLYAIVGIHPHHADKHDLESDWLEQLKGLAKHSKVVAIGEIGLDYYHYKSNGIVDPKLQKEIFEKQIDLAYNLKLPLQIHNRHAGDDILEIVNLHKNKLQNPPGMFHCFAGSIDVLKKALDLGFYIGFDGNVTYKGLAPGESIELFHLSQLTPLDRIVIETDSPFLTPVPYRGSRNEPQYAILVRDFIAGCKKITPEELELHINTNTQKLFNIPKV